MARKILLLFFVGLILGCSQCYAGDYSEIFWYLDGDEVKTLVNPDDADRAWLDQNWSDVLILVQQTIYDYQETVDIFSAHDLTPPAEGFLYSYWVTNVNWFDSVSSGGLKGFGVNWGFEPSLVLTSPLQTPEGWVPSATDGGPEWIWQLNTPGLLPGDTVGGLWALAPTMETRIVQSTAATGDLLDPNMLEGAAVAPVPEPCSILVLATGAFGLAVRRLKR